MLNKNKLKKVSDKPDSRLSGPYPTAHSNEFIPKPSETLPSNLSDNSGEIFDFIPQLKSEKYK